MGGRESGDRSFDADQIGFDRREPAQAHIDTTLGQRLEHIRNLTDEFLDVVHNHNESGRARELARVISRELDAARAEVKRSG